MVYVISCASEICFITDNEHDILKYLEHMPQSGYDRKEFTEYMEMSPYTWLDNGHIIDEITEFLNVDWDVFHYHLGIDYKHDSPTYCKEIK